MTLIVIRNHSVEMKCIRCLNLIALIWFSSNATSVRLLRTVFVLNLCIVHISHIINVDGGTNFGWMVRYLHVRFSSKSIPKLRVSSFAVRCSSCSVHEDKAPGCSLPSDWWFRDRCPYWRHIRHLYLDLTSCSWPGENWLRRFFWDGRMFHLFIRGFTPWTDIEAWLSINISLLFCVYAVSHWLMTSAILLYDILSMRTSFDNTMLNVMPSGSVAVVSSISNSLFLQRQRQ